MGDIPDRMSALPDDILIAIISRLTLIEATATSILSHRWRYLHSYVTRLEFPPFTLSKSELWSCYNNDDPLIASEKRFGNHVKMIDGVLDSHRGGGVKEMKMHMHRMKGASVEKWVEFAFTKQIEIIDISLQVTPLCCYSLGLSKLINGTHQIKFLKQLSLDGIHMNDQDFELLFSNSNFVALESVSIQGMRDLKKVTIVGHPKLKHVDIRFFSNGSLESLEIRDVMNLLSLCLYNLSVGCAVKLENIPKLTEFYYGEFDRTRIAHEELFARMPSCILDQLQLLHISINDDAGPDILLRLPFKFMNIKHMELELKISIEPRSFYRVEPLIRACPSLQKLKIKFDRWLLYWIEMGERKASVYNSYLKKLSPNLKELEMEGYVGSKPEFELASYIINCAANLERVIVLPNNATKDIQREAAARAKSDFQKIAPPPRFHVKFK